MTPTRAETRARRLPDHDAVAKELRSWFTTSVPEIGYLVSEHWYGYLSDQESFGPRLVLELDEPDRVPAALAEASAACRGGELSVWADSRAAAALLDEALQRSGCRPVKATTHLALVGELRADEGPAELQIDRVGPSELDRWAALKLQCFDNSESIPAPSRIDREVAVRRAELPLAELLLGSIEGEPVAVLGYYRGRDQLAFNLGVRVRYRHRGIAQSMLSYWVGAARDSSCRSIIINADDPGRPKELYRRIGFVDEVYWYRRYRFAGPEGQGRPAT